MVPGIGGEHGIAGGDGDPFAASAEAEPHLAAHRLQGGVGAALAGIPAQDALHVGRRPPELDQIVVVAVPILHLDLVHAAGDVEAHATLLERWRSPGQVGIAQGEDVCTIHIHVSAATKSVEEGVVPRLEPEVPRPALRDAGIPLAVPIIITVHEPRPPWRIDGIHGVLRPVHAPVGDWSAIPVHVAPGFLIEVAVRVHRFTLAQGVEPGGDGELTIAQVQAGAAIHVEIVVAGEVGRSLAEDAVGGVRAAGATLRVVAHPGGVGVIGVPVSDLLLFLKLQAEDRSLKEVADLLLCQGPLEDAHVVYPAVEVAAVGGGRGLPQIGGYLVLEGASTIPAGLQLAVQKDGLLVLVLIVAVDEVIPDLGLKSDVALQGVVGLHVGLAIIREAHEEAVKAGIVCAQDCPEAGEIAALDPGRNGETAVSQAQPLRVGQADGLRAIELHRIVKVAGFPGLGAGGAGAATIGRRHGARTVGEGDDAACLIQLEPQLGEAGLLAPVGDEGAGHLGQTDGAGGGDVGRLHRAGYGRLLQRLQDEGAGRYVDLGQGRRIGGGQGEQALGVAVVELVAHRGRVAQGIAYLDEGVVGVVAGLQQLVLDLGSRECAVKYGHLVYEAHKALHAGGAIPGCCGADEQGIVGVGMGGCAVGDGPLVDTVHVEGDVVVAIHHGGHVLPRVGLKADAREGIILHPEGGETQIRTRGAKAKAVVAVGPGCGHDASHARQLGGLDPGGHGEVVAQVVDRAVGNAQELVAVELHSGAVLAVPARVGTWAYGTSSVIPVTRVVGEGL